MNDVTSFKTRSEPGEVIHSRELLSQLVLTATGRCLFYSDILTGLVRPVTSSSCPSIFSHSMGLTTVVKGHAILLPYNTLARDGVL